MNPTALTHYLRNCCVNGSISPCGNKGYCKKNAVPATTLYGWEDSPCNGADRKAAIILLLLVAVVTAPSLSHSFLFMDDYALIVNNPKLGLTLADLPLLFSRPLGDLMAAPGSQPEGTFYRPALSLLYALNYWIWGVNPVGFHITNIALHLLNAIAVYHLGLLLFDTHRTAALLSASLFAVHPVHNELLGRVAMNENLYGFFAILTVYSYLLEKKVLALALFAAALLSKESAVMLPFVIFLISVSRSGLKKSAYGMLPFAILLGWYCFGRILVVGSFAGGSNPLPLHINVFNMSVALTEYARLLLIPYPLHPFYPARFFTSLSDPHVLAATGILCCLGIFFWKSRKNYLHLSLFLSGFFLLAPAIVKANQLAWGQECAFVAERQLYVPSMFFALLASGLILRCSKNITTLPAKGIAFAILAIFSCITISQNRVWRDDQTVTSAIITDCPDISLSRIFMAERMFANRNFEGARREYTAALFPNTATQNILKQLNLTQGKLYYNNELMDASKLEPLAAYNKTLAPMHYNIGRTYFAEADYASAIRKFKVAVILQPHFDDAYSYLGSAYLRLGQFSEARVAFRNISRSMGNRGA